jgi:hypothetical protein
MKHCGDTFLPKKKKVFSVPVRRCLSLKRREFVKNISFEEKNLSTFGDF